MTAIAVRAYQPSDQAQIRALHDRTPPAGTAPSDSPQLWPADLDHIAECYLAFWVAVDGSSEIVGFAGIALGGADVPAFVLRGRSNVARLKRMRVAPEWQRQGIGRRLTETAIDFVRRNGYGALILETTAQQAAAIALYQHMSFVEVGRSHVGRFELIWFELQRLQLD